MSEPTYTLSPDGRAITCHYCDVTSYHPLDVQHRYCGACHRFHAPLESQIAPHDTADPESEIARLQQQYLDALKANTEVAKMNADLQAELLDLRDAATDLLNQLTLLRYPDMSTIWRLGGGSLEAAYQVLKDALDAARRLYRARPVDLGGRAARRRRQRD